MIIQGRKEQKQVVIEHKTNIYNIYIYIYIYIYIFIYSSTLFCHENWA